MLATAGKVWTLSERAVELGQTLLALIYGGLWESSCGRMKDCPLSFTVVPHKDRAFSHHLEVGPFPSDFFFSSVLGPFLRAGEEIGSSGEVVDLFEIKVVDLTRVIFQVQYNSAYPPGFNDPPNAIDFCIFLFFLGFCTLCRARSRD